MKSLFDKLRAYHQAFWVFDPWYRRAWYFGPPGVAAVILALVMSPAGSAPTDAPWSKPAGGDTSTASSNPDHKLCMTAGPDAAVRGQACDRLIKAGGLSANDLSWAYYGRAWMKESAKDIPGATQDYALAVKTDATNAEATHNLGGMHLVKDEIDQALKYFEATLKLAPKHAQALANKAEVLRRKGKLSDAQAEVKKSLDVDGNNPRAKDVQTAILADIRTLEANQQAGSDLPLCRNAQADGKARGEACDRLIKKGGLPPSIMSDAYFGRGFMRENANDPAGAIADYSESIRLNPQSQISFNNRGGLLLARGELADALRDYDEALKINDRYVLARANRAEVLRRQGKLADAQADIAKAQAIDANHLRVKFVADLIATDLKKQGQGVQGQTQTGPVQQANNDPQLEELRARGRKHLDNNDLDSAIADYTDVIRRGSVTWVDYNQRGRAHMKKGENAQAIQDFERAGALANHGPEAHYNLALVLERMGNLAKARENLEAAITQHGTKDPDFYVRLADILGRQGEHKLAVETFEKLIKIQDADKSAKPEDRAFTFLHSGRAKKNEIMAERHRCTAAKSADTACMNPIRFAPAILDFQQALIFKPNFDQAYFEQGWIAAEIGNTKSAIEEYTKAIKANPGYVAAYNNRGVQYEKAKQPDLALADYNDALRIDGNNKYAWANRGVLFANTGQRQKAIEDLQRARALDSKYEYAITNLRRLGVKL